MGVGGQLTEAAASLEFPVQPVGSSTQVSTPEQLLTLSLP